LTKEFLEQKEFFVKKILTENFNCLYNPSVMGWDGRTRGMMQFYLLLDFYVKCGMKGKDLKSMRKQDETKHLEGSPSLAH